MEEQSMSIDAQITANEEEECECCLDATIADAKCMGAVGNGMTDDTAALQAWLDDSRGTKFLPSGTYMVSDQLNIANSARRIFGAGRRASVIKALSGHTGAMLHIKHSGATTTIGSIIIDDVGFDGDGNAQLGVYFERANFSYLNRVEISHVNGVGLHFYGVQDCGFHALDVRKCGVYHSSHASAKPCVWIQAIPDTGNPGKNLVDSNSLFFFGGDIERNHYPFVMEICYQISLIGMKGHGRTTADDTTPPSADLFQLRGAQRVRINSCQLSHARRNSIFITEDEFGKASNAIITGCFFTEPANYATLGEAWHIWAEKARCQISDNYFGEGLLVDNVVHASYKDRGGDIFLDENILDVGGQNMHYGDGRYPVRRNFTSKFFRQPSLNGFMLNADPFRGLIALRIDHLTGGSIATDTWPRIELTNDGRVRFGNGTVNVDTSIERKSANRLGLGDDDTFQLAGTWDQGLLRLGAYRIWVDPGTNKLMMNNADPTAANDGWVIGP
jgi:hypothetical protein